MGFFDTLLRGAVGFATGGPVGAGLGLLSGVAGGGGSPAPGRAASSAATTSPLQEVLQKEAWLQGFQQVMGGGPNGPAAQNFDVPVPRLGEQSRQANRRANQAGGHAFSPESGRQQPDGFGGGMAAPSPALGNLFEDYMQRGLSGQGGLPASAYMAALARGTSNLNQQAQVGRANLAADLGQRGLLTSGLMGEGLAGIERSRLAALGDFTAGLEDRNLAAARSTQDQTARLYAAQQQQAVENAARLNLLGRQIDASQPQWWEPWAQLANAYVLWQNRPQTTTPAPITRTPIL